MNKCKTCKYRSYHLRCLKCEQAEERKHKQLKPAIVNPLKSYIEGLDTLTDDQRLKLLGLVIYDLSFRRIGLLLHISHHTAKRIAKHAIKGIF